MRETRKSSPDLRPGGESRDWLGLDRREEKVAVQVRAVGHWRQTQGSRSERKDRGTGTRNLADLHGGRALGWLLLPLPSHGAPEEGARGGDERPCALGLTSAPSGSPFPQAESTQLHE